MSDEPPHASGAEPYDPRRPTRITPAILLIAGVAVAAGVWLGPSSWPTGDGALLVTYRGSDAAPIAVTVGDTTPFSAQTAAGAATIAVELPAGVPIDATVEAAIRVVGDGEATPIAVRDVELVLRLPDDRHELIPIVGTHDDGTSLAAQRRPPVRSSTVLGLLGLVIVLWVTEAIPLFVTSMIIPVVLVVTTVAPADDALAPFFHPVIALFFGGFLMAEALRRAGLDRRVALAIVANAGASPVRLYLALLGTAAFMSMWMSNTAAVAILIPVALAVAGPLGSDGFRKAAVLGIAYAATIGGVGSAIGTPANPLALAFLRDITGRRISFVEWFAFGLPMVALMLPLIALVVWRRYRPSVEAERFGRARAVARDQLTTLGTMTRAEVTVLVVLVGVIAVWLTQTWHGVNTGIVAIAGAVVLALVRRIEPEDLGRISWASLLTFGGGLSLGFALVSSGTSDWLATRLAGLGGVPSLVAIIAVAGLTLAVTTVASNTASAAMLIPLSIPLATVLGLEPVTLAAVVAIASSIDFALVIGTPPTMLAYSTNLFTPREIFRTGAVLDLAGLLVLAVAVVGIWGVTGII